MKRVGVQSVDTREPSDDGITPLVQELNLDAVLGLEEPFSVAYRPWSASGIIGDCANSIWTLFSAIVNPAQR
jgi:hypothetical protein